jgi:hypothetical protein
LTSEFAQRQRRKFRREEWGTQTRLASLLSKHLDPSTTFWTSLENKPRSLLSGLLQKKRGMRSGLPDVMVIFRQRSVFVEVKSRSGRASKAQKQVRDELAAVGCEWWLCRSARAALTALHRSGVELRAWRPVPLHPWEGPFTGAERRLPQHPEVRARQREACRRWREKKRALKRDDSAHLASGAQSARGAGSWPCRIGRSQIDP